MRRIIATFSGRAYDPTTKLIVERGPQMGADEVWVFDDKWLMGTGYYDVNRWLFKATSRIHGEGMKGHVYSHGFSWCSWKSFVIQSAMDRLQDGDVVLYLDADTFPINPFGQLFDCCAREGGIMVFEEQGSNLRFTKASCRLVMNLPEEEGPHYCGRFSLWQKGSFIARQVLTEWWAYSINRHCQLWDASTICADPPEYFRHSTEQSVLSNLGIKYKLPRHRSPDQNGVDKEGKLAPGALDADLYPVQLFEQLWCAGDRGDLSGSSYRNV